MMRIILREDVPSLGVVGDIVSVRDGYARNFLIPQRRADFASVRSVGELDHQKRLANHRREAATAQAGADRSRIEGISVCMSAKVAPPAVNEDGKVIEEKLQKLFGSITARDIAKVLADSGVKVESRRIKLSSPVRRVGKYIAAVRLDGGVTAELPFWVIPEGVPDIETEKKRVEAAQEAARKEKEKSAKAEQVVAAALASSPAPEKVEATEEGAETSEAPAAEEKTGD